MRRENRKRWMMEERRTQDTRNRKGQEVYWAKRSQEIRSLMMAVILKHKVKNMAVILKT